MIRIENLNKYYNKGRKNQIHVINNTSLELGETGITALLGPSGCGKSSLIKSICKLEKANGTIIIDNINLNNLNISTITIGANTKAITSIMFSFGRIGILKIVLRAGTNKITSISNADIPIAPRSFLFPEIPVLNIVFLLSLMLNTCTSSENASTMNAIVCPTSILDFSSVNPFIGSFVVASPIAYAASVSNPIINP